MPPPDLSREAAAALVQEARVVRERAYAPYSRFAVGAAVRDGKGRIFTGANVENASLGLTLCAERAALAAAVAGGALDAGIQAVAVVTESGATPCGACRQVLAELAPEAIVLVARPAGPAQRFTVADLLPAAFRDYRSP